MVMAVRMDLFICMRGCRMHQLHRAGISAFVPGDASVYQLDLSFRAD